MGGSSSDHLEGDEGNDILHGNAGNDWMLGREDDDTLYGGDGGDTLFGDVGIDSLYGESGNDSIDGGSRDDVIDGGIGVDAMTGGTGDDVFVVDDGDSVIEILDEGTDTVQASITYALGADVENLTLTGSDDLDGTGNAFDNVIFGNTGNNTLLGGDGDDSIDGGSGDDVIDGGIGADAMTGGTGDDVFVVDDAGDSVTEGTNQGTDTVQSSITYGLDADVENLTLTGSDDLDATGNALDNVILGNAGANTLIGGAGDDTIDGGTGTDPIDFSGAVGSTGGVSVNLSLTTAQTIGVDQGVDIILNIENVIGSALNDSLTGDASANVIDGGTGDDTLAGGGGDDTLTGGLGNDAFTFMSGFGDDTIKDFGAGVGSEDVIAFGPDAPSVDEVGSLSYTIGTIGSFAEMIEKTLTDVDGDAVMSPYWIGTTQISIGSITFEGVESTALHEDDFSNIYGDGDDAIVGTGGADLLFGMAGDDSIDGGAGDDRLWGGDGDDILIGGAGDDVLDGRDGNNILTGGSGNDRFSIWYADQTITDFSTDPDSGDELDFNLYSAMNSIITGPADVANTLAYASDTGTFANMLATQFSDVNGSAVASMGFLSVTLEGVSTSELSSDNFTGL